MTNPQSQTILCPVCRARQGMQSQCRRCAADLTLYCKTLAAVHAAKNRYAAAQQRRDEPAARSELDYLSWLSPREAAQLPLWD